MVAVGDVLGEVVGEVVGETVGEVFGVADLVTVTVGDGLVVTVDGW